MLPVALLATRCERVIWDSGLINLHPHGSTFTVLGSLTGEGVLVVTTQEGSILLQCGNQRHTVTHLFGSQVTAAAIRLIARAPRETCMHTSSHCVRTDRDRDRATTQALMRGEAVRRPARLSV